MPRPQRAAPSPGARTTRAYAATLRHQANAPGSTVPRPQGSPGWPWSPVSGQVRREQEAWLSRTSGGIRLLVVGAFVLPLMIGALTTSAGMEDVVGGALAGLMLLLLPLAFLVVLMSLGGAGPLGLMGRAMGNSTYVGSSLAWGRRQRGGPGRVLILSTPRGELRVAVARAIDLPIGTTVTVRGPRFGGYLHAWTIQADGLDPRPLFTRGVLPTLVLAGFSLVLTVTQVVGALVGVAR